MLWKIDSHLEDCGLVVPVNEVVVEAGEGVCIGALSSVEEDEVVTLATSSDMAGSS